VIDYLDDTIKTPEDITRRLKLRFLGMVPIVPGERHPLISGPVPHDFGEAYRSIRTAIAGTLTGPGARVIAVASSQPLEGKTTTAVNLAMALAVGGARVLLIDADMRRPSVHKALRMTNDRGLSQLLAGQARMREVVQRTHDPNLLTITAGRTPANPSELLASDRMRALLTGLESGPFDWIVIDTPPVLAVTDAMILAPLVSAVTFVIGAEMTRQRLAERAVETMLSSNPRMVLAVLNKVDVGRNKYYYSRYYGHQYKNYYAESPAGLDRAANAAPLTNRGLLHPLRGRTAVDVDSPVDPDGRRRAGVAAPDLRPAPRFARARPLPHRAHGGDADSDRAAAESDRGGPVAACRRGSRIVALSATRGVALDAAVAGRIQDRGRTGDRGAGR
jgi:capsular exopolysaccharide synthesis family protein